MAQVADRHETWLAAAEARLIAADAEPAGVRAARAAALTRFADRGVPTTRDEEWRFTNVAPIAAAGFAPAAPATLDVATLAPFLFNDAFVHRIVLTNGRFDANLSAVGTLPGGLTVRRLADVLATDDGSALALFDATGHTAFADLNTAVCEDALVVDVAPRAVIEAPLLILSVSTGDAGMVSPRLLIRVGEQAQVRLVESFASVGDSPRFTNAVTQIAVGPAAVVDHVKLQEESVTAFHLATTTVRVARDGSFASRALTLGGRLTRNDIVSVLAGEGASCTLDGMYVADGESLVDTHTTIDHAQPHCPSHEVYKGILTGRAQAVFNGKIIVRQVAQKTDAKQSNMALLMSGEAQINTKPQLEIFADDVRCTHGAAIGQLDEDALFYLRARGINAIDARNLLIHAFAGQVLDGIAVDAVREHAVRLMEAKLRLEHL